jgi:hypothetical protein
MEGRETGSAGQKKAGVYLDQYKKNGIPYPTIAADYYQKIPAAFLNAKYNETCLILKIFGPLSKVQKKMKY